MLLGQARFAVHARPAVDRGQAVGAVPFDDAVVLVAVLRRDFRLGRFQPGQRLDLIGLEAGQPLGRFDLLPLEGRLRVGPLLLDGRDRRSPLFDFRECRQDGVFEFALAGGRRGDFDVLGVELLLRRGAVQVGLHFEEPRLGRLQAALVVLLLELPPLDGVVVFLVGGVLVGERLLLDFEDARPEVDFGLEVAQVPPQPVALA